jgi:tetratricopeptide (TPR) repeat protein
MAALLLATCAATGCDRLVQAERDHSYAIARSMPGVDDSSLTIPTRGLGGYPSATTNPLAIRRLLRQGAFARLDSLLDAAADSARRDYHHESVLFGDYLAFGGDTSLAAPLERWARERPQSAPARIARGAYLADMAWRARGTATSRDTPSESIRRMQVLFGQAVSAVDSALAWTPRSGAAYYVLLQTARAHGGLDSSRHYLEKGLEDIPESFGLRRQHMRNLSPRWGGSYAAMRALADESEKAAAGNPRLRSLAGYVLLDSAEVLELSGARPAALAAYDRVIAGGDEAFFFLERGELLERMLRYRDAVPDFDRAIASAPADEAGYLWRGTARQALWTENGRSDSADAIGALADYQRAVLLRPTDGMALDRFLALYLRIGPGQ